MVNPQPTDAHLRMAHTIEEEIMMRDFDKRQRKVVDFILRLSWGCGKKSAFIPMQKDFELVGIDQTKAKAVIEWLINAKVISRDETGKLYSFNKNFDEWKVSIVPNYNKDRFNELLRLNISTCQKSNSLAKKASEDDGLDETASLEGAGLDEKASADLTKKQVILASNATDETFASLPKESSKEIDVVEEVEDARACEAEIYKFYNQNIGLITGFQSEIIGQYLDGGMHPDTILTVLQDSIGKDDKWSWVKKVLQNLLESNIQTKEQYEAQKVQRANSRDRPNQASNNRPPGNKPPQTKNFEQRKHGDDYFDNVYKEV